MTITIPPRVPPFYLNHIRCYHSGSEWTWEQWPRRGIPHSPNLQGWSLAIRLVNIISGDNVMRGTYLSAVGVFYSPNWLGWRDWSSKSLTSKAQSNNLVIIPQNLPLSQNNTLMSDYWSGYREQYKSCASNYTKLSKFHILYKEIYEVLVFVSSFAKNIPLVKEKKKKRNNKEMKIKWP